MTDWVWKAIYRNGECLDEYLPDGSGKTAGFAAVDRDRLAAFVLVPQRAGLPTAHIVVPEDRDFEPIFFRRHALSVNTSKLKTAGRTTVPVLGFRRRSQGVAAYMALFPDGSVALTEDEAQIEP